MNTKKRVCIAQKTEKRILIFKALLYYPEQQKHIDFPKKLSIILGFLWRETWDFTSMQETGI